MMQIRTMLQSDIDMIVGWLSGTDEPFMHQWGGGRWYTHPINADQMKKRFNERTENTRYFIAECDGVPFGSAELDFIDWTEKKCSVCRFLVAPGKRGSGLSVPFMNALTAYAFNDLDMRQVTLSVFDFNAPAMQCYAKAGFIENGRVLRDNGWVAINMIKER